MQGVATVSGLATGLPTDQIIQKLMDLEQKPIQQYQAQQDQLNQQLSTFQQANTRLAAVGDAAGQLADPTFFESRTATSSSPTTLTATASVGAAPGQYVVTVNSLARAHQIASQPYADLDSTRVGTGTFSITSNGQTTTVQVDSNNNTLRGLRDAINNANTNVTASIVQDGDSSYRLLISSKQTGTANALTVTSAPSGGTNPTFSDLQTAQDAKVTLGSGANAINIVRSTNTIKDLVPGVTLNLASEAPNTPVTVTVAQDTSKIQDAVQKLVDQYNNASDFLNQQFSFNSDTQQGGTLLGNFTLQNAQNALADVMGAGVAGARGGAASLADVGLSLDGSGKLSLDSGKLQQKLAADPEAVKHLFALTAQADNAGVSLVSAGPKNSANGTTYSVQITQAATQARVTAGAALSGPLAADETLTINGVAVNLTAGMTQAQVLSAINARTADTGVRVSATAADGTGTGSYLTFRSAGYGSGAAISVASSRSNGAAGSTGVGNVAATQASPGGESGHGTGAAGQDVAGTINGEAATGKGQILSGNAGNATTDGLQLAISATTTGSLGTIRLSSGTAFALQQTLDGITDSKNGPIQSEEDGINERIKYLQKIIDEANTAAKAREDDLRQKFNDLETTMSSLQSQSAELASQLASLR